MREIICLNNMIPGLLHLVLESLGPTMLLQTLFRSFSQLSNILVCVCFSFLFLVIWRVNSLERPSCWARLKAEGEKGNRAWEGWMASPVVRIIPYYKIITFPTFICLSHTLPFCALYILVQHLHILMNIHLQFLVSADI